MKALQERLAEAIAKRTTGEDDRDTAIPNLTFFRRETLTGPNACLIGPSIVFVVQGC